ncbi:MAG: NAD(P)-dependent alcohol dehydrogenase [Anaerolineae bacterium]
MTSTHHSLPILAAVLRRRGGPFTIEPLEMDAPREDEILVRVVASGVCHTDIAMADGWDGSIGPVVLGHEGAGIVEQVGAAVHGVHPGDHVVLSFASCGGCAACQAGRPAHCERLGELNFGFQRADGSNALWRSNVRGHFFGQSSFATHVLATERNTVVVDPDLPLETLAPLGCGMQTGAGAVLNSLNVPAGASLAILGTGAVGLAALMAGRIAGADPLIAVDRVPARLALARELGATQTVDTDARDLAAELATIVPDGLQVALDTTSVTALRRAALQSLAPGGTLALVTGVGDLGPLPEGCMLCEVIEGDADPREFIPRLISLWQAGRFPYDRLIRSYPFEEINEAVAGSRSGATIKPVLRMEG